jgi:hypothetical protein
MEENKSNITCAIFKKQELLIAHITDKINTSKGVEEKARFAEELKDAAELLLSCPQYDKGMLDCRNCNLIANLRKRTANLIIKAKKLA